MRGIALYGKEFFVIKQEIDLIKENISRILLTLPGERVLNYDFGCKLKSFLFAPDLVLQEDVENEIRQSITRWEPRVEVSSVSAEMVDNSKVYIKLDLISRTTLQVFNYETLIRY